MTTVIVSAETVDFIFLGIATCICMVVWFTACGYISIPCNSSSFWKVLFSDSSFWVCGNDKSLIMK